MFGAAPWLSYNAASSANVTISSVTTKPTTSVGNLEYFLNKIDWFLAKTKCPLTKKSPAPLLTNVPCPVDGLAVVFVDWTVRVVAPEVMFSPGVNLTGVVPDKLLGLSAVSYTHLRAHET